MRKLLLTMGIAGFAITALFGVVLSVPTSHDMVCPFEAGCVTTLEHLNHWQSAFAAILAELIVLVTAAVWFTQTLPIPLRTSLAEKQRTRTPWPLYLQELFSQGILHRKEPYHA